LILDHLFQRLEFLVYVEVHPALLRSGLLSEFQKRNLIFRLDVLLLHFLRHLLLLHLGRWLSRVLVFQEVM
jgi:hypothetical protein